MSLRKKIKKFFAAQSGDEGLRLPTANVESQVSGIPDTIGAGNMDYSLLSSAPTSVFQGGGPFTQAAKASAQWASDLTPSEKESYIEQAKGRIAEIKRRLAAPGRDFFMKGGF